MHDRNGKYSTSTCIVCAFLGFALGFLACHKLYTGLESKDLTIPMIEVYTP